MGGRSGWRGLQNQSPGGPNVGGPDVGGPLGAPDLTPGLGRHVSLCRQHGSGVGCLGGHPGSASGQGSKRELENHLPGAWECLRVQGSSWVPESTRVREEEE